LIRLKHFQTQILASKVEPPSTPIYSDIKIGTPPMWTEVVRRGRNRSKSNKISVNDRRILEY
jgi:hypothetical protein